MGCITRLAPVCSSLVGLAVAGWFTRDMWMSRLATRASHAPTAVVADGTREPLSDAAADTMRAALKRAQPARGQVFETLSPAALASYAYQQVAKRLPTAADSVEAMANGDKPMRAVVSVSDLGGAIGDAVGIVHDQSAWSSRARSACRSPGSRCSRSPTRGFTGCRSPRA